MWRRRFTSLPLFFSHLQQVRRADELKICQAFCTETVKPPVEGESNSGRNSPFVAFVLGGPGSGKGTQCLKIAETFGFDHIGAGDLLRKEMHSDSENGAMIQKLMKEGSIAPSEVTVKLIKKAIESAENRKFLIDGFPRSEENRVAYERIIGAEPNFVLFFDCPEEVMVKRVLNRNEGRVDDNEHTVKERLKVYKAITLPVANHYAMKGKLYKVDGTGTQEEIFERVRPIFASLRLST
ncbi:UMP-CMP kinase isoform X2 [Solanum lycopersicum]|nr:UMP-CMP kinase isoform X2 [Solanum lycopersicum]XP_010318004.1 UMP-CMP kinase isoform X2 [Solanum lycopersicum]